jgi:hypothetical protein
MTPPLEAQATNPACRAALCSVPIDPKPFILTADPDAVIEKVRRGRKMLAAIG